MICALYVIKNKKTSNWGRWGFFRPLLKGSHIILLVYDWCLSVIITTTEALTLIYDAICCSVRNLLVATSLVGHSPHFSVRVYCCKTTWPFNHSTFAGTLLAHIYVDYGCFFGLILLFHFFYFIRALFKRCSVSWWHWWSPQTKNMSI